MTERDTSAIQEESRGDLPTTPTAAIRGALTGPRAAGALAGLALIVLAGIVAPGEAPGPWAWARVLLIGLLAAVALTSIAGATLDARMPRTSPLVVWGSLLLAVVVSLTFTAVSSALAILILLLLLLNLRPGGAMQPAIFWLLLAVLTPLWVWSAFEAWDPWLLMLIPIGGFGAVALEQAARSSTEHSRARRLASWIMIVALAAALLLTALLADLPTGWVAGGGITAIVLSGIDLLAIRSGGTARLPAVAVPLLALAALTIGWLVAL